MRINTNVPALRSVLSAKVSEKQMAILSRRLSTGTRVSSAKDDPAGMATSTRLKFQVGGTQMASQNAMNGISVLQTADAGLNEAHLILQRMRELAVEAANDTNTSSDRLKVQREIDELAKEIDSIAEKTEYNRINLLSGHAGLKGTSENAEVLRMTDNVEPGEYAITVTTAAERAEYKLHAPGTFPQSGVITLNGIELEITAADTEETAWAKLEEAARASGVTVEYSDDDSNEFTPPKPTGLVSDYYGAGHKIEIASNNSDLLKAFGLPGVNVPGVDAVADTVSDPSIKPGFPADAKISIDGNRVTVTDSQNRQMAVEISPADDPASTVAGRINIKVDDNRLVFHTGANMDINVEVSIGEVSGRSLGIDRISVATVASATEAINALDNAVSRVSEIRSKIGSYENRLELTNTNLETADISLQTLLSKVFDTDMAYDMAEYSRQQIVNRGAMSILSQANQRPQSVLQLIK